MNLDKDYRDILQLFEKHEVEYLVVGGIAVCYYAKPRSTQDLDLWVEVSDENLERVNRAVGDFGGPKKVATDGVDLGSGEWVELGGPESHIDIIGMIKGCDFSDCWERRTDDTVEGIKAQFISKDDLIASKQAARRPQDLVDVENIKTYDQEKERHRKHSQGHEK